MRLIPSGIRHALRRLAATPALSLGAMLTLALGIGSAVVMADVLDRLLLRAPVHVVDPDRVARIYVAGKGAAYIDRTDYATLEALAVLHEDLDAAAAFLTESLSLGRGEHARRLEAVACSPQYFRVLGVQPQIGSWSEWEHSNTSSKDSAVISHALWQQEFGGSPDVIGRAVRLGLDTYTVAAVAPRGFVGVGFKRVDVWLPLETRARAGYGADWKTMPGIFLQVIARLRPGVSRDRASERATASYRGTHAQVWERTNTVVLGDLRPARAPGTHVQTRVEVLVAGMSLLVLLITCGNVANVLLVRGLRREREFVVKTALGASRARLLREVMLEAALLAAGAGVAALVVVTIGGALLRRLFLSPVMAVDSPLDARLVLITVVFCAVAAFLLGVVPALRLTEQRALNPGHGTALPPSRIVELFAGVQIALTVPMIVTAALFVLSLWQARHQDFGMQTDHVAVVTTNLFEVGRPWDNHVAHREMQRRLAQLPQVEATALVENLPMATSVTFGIEVPGKDLWKGTFTSDSLPMSNPVDPSYFTVMRMRLLEGRYFTDDENRKGAKSVAVVTASMAHYIWPGEPAVGKCFYLGGRGKDTPCTEVVGVVADARLFPSIRPTTQWASAYYIPIEQAVQQTSSRALIVRTVGDPAKVLQTLRQESQVVVADLPYVDAHGFDDVFEAMLRPWRLGSTVFVVFGALAMIVAAVGLAVVAAEGVTRRTREIGIRAALGAAPQHLVRLVLRRSLLVIGCGLSTGIALAWVSSRILNPQLFNVSATEPRVLVPVALAVIVVGTGAAWMPARRAARIDPLSALRAE
jgi:putative ABC transport system permease protein